MSSIHDTPGKRNQKNDLEVLSRHASPARNLASSALPTKNINALDCNAEGSVSDGHCPHPWNAKTIGVFRPFVRSIFAPLAYLDSSVAYDRIKPAPYATRTPSDFFEKQACGIRMVFDSNCSL